MDALHDNDVITVMRRGQGEADAFIERPATSESQGWNRALPR